MQPESESLETRFLLSSKMGWALWIDHGNGVGDGGDSQGSGSQDWQKNVEEFEDPIESEDVIRIEDVGEFMVDLRGMARRLLGGDKNANSIRPTALIMSALVRSKRQGQKWTALTWANREHFFAVMHREMRRCLIDHARKRNAARRPPLLSTDPMDFDLYDLPRLG